MDLQETLVHRLLAAHKSLFDIRENYQFKGHVFPGFAEFHSNGQQYVLVKRAKLWEVNSHEFVFIDAYDYLDESSLSKAIDFMKEEAFQKVPHGPNHMATAISLIIVANSVSDDAVKLVGKTRYRKSYLFSIHGWADFRLAVVDLSREKGRQVFTNPAGKRSKELLERNLEFSQKD